jgi:hypothetical protein
MSQTSLYKKWVEFFTLYSATTKTILFSLFLNKEIQCLKAELKRKEELLNDTKSKVKSFENNLKALDLPFELWLIILSSNNEFFF